MHAYCAGQPGSVAEFRQMRCQVVDDVAQGDRAVERLRINLIILRCSRPAIVRGKTNHRICAGPGSLQLHPAITAAATAPVALSTATTCAGKMPVTPAGETGSARGFAGQDVPAQLCPRASRRPGRDRARAIRCGRRRKAARQENRLVGRVPVNCPGGGAKGNIMALHTPE